MTSGEEKKRSVVYLYRISMIRLYHVIISASITALRYTSSIKLSCLTYPDLSLNPVFTSRLALTCDLRRRAGGPDDSSLSDM